MLKKLVFVLKIMNFLLQELHSVCCYNVELTWGSGGLIYLWGWFLSLHLLGDFYTIFIQSFLFWKIYYKSSLLSRLISRLYFDLLLHIWIERIILIIFHIVPQIICISICICISIDINIGIGICLGSSGFTVDSLFGPLNWT